MRNISAIDHFIYAVPNLDTACAEFEEQSGISPTIGGRHTDFGTHNALVSLGDKVYFEFLAPDPERKTESPNFLKGLERPVLLAWAVAVTDLEGLLSHSDKLTEIFGSHGESERKDNTGATLKWKASEGPSITVPAPQPIPFLLQWTAGAHPASTSAKGCSLDTLTLYHPENEMLSATLDALSLKMSVEHSNQARISIKISTPRGILEFE